MRERIIPVNPEVLSVNPYPVEAGREQFIRLDINENLWGCSPGVIQALQKWLSSVEAVQRLATYPDVKEVVQAIAQHLNLPEDFILLTGGADDGIRTVVETFVQKGKKVLIPVPSFSIVIQRVLLCGGEVITVPFGEPPEFRFPGDGLLDQLYRKRPVVAVFTHPHSYVPHVLSKVWLEHFLKEAYRLSCMVLVDEAYMGYVPEKESMVSLVPQYSNLIVARSFSKVFGLAGLRVGYLVASPSVIDLFRRVVLPFPVNQLALQAVRAIVANREYVQEIAGATEAVRRWLVAQLRERAVQAFESHANFVLVHVGSRCSHILKTLRQNGILVKDLSNMPVVRGFLRVTVGPKPLMDRFLEVFFNSLPQQALLLDMDGVLVDVRDSYLRAIQETVAHFSGAFPSMQEIEQAKHEPNSNNDWIVAQRLIHRRCQREIPLSEIRSVFQRIYWGEGHEPVGLITQERWLVSPAILEELFAHYRIGIVTGRPRREAEYVLERAGVRTLIEVLIAMEDCPPDRQKPHPYGLQRAMEKLGVASAVYVGDSVDDMRMAKALGIPAIGVTYAYNDPEMAERKLRAAGAMHIVRQPEELIQALQALHGVQT